MLKLDWKSDKMKNALRNIVVVGLSFLFIYFLILLIELVPAAFQIDLAMYLVNVAEITVDIITTAAGVFLGLSMFFLLVRFFSRQDGDDAPGETLPEDE